MITIKILFLLSQMAYAAPASYFTDLESFKKNSLSIQSEKENLKATSDNLLSKKLFWTPELSLSATQSQTNLDSNAGATLKSVSANLSWNLFRGGADISGLSLAEAQKKLQEIELTNEILRVEIKASDLIFKSLYLNESVRIQSELVKMKEESLRIVSDRYQQGKLPQQEVIKSQVDLSQQKNRLRNSELEELENKSTMATLFINKLETLSWPFNEEQKKTKIDDFRSFPSVQSKYWISQASNEALSIANKSFFPTLQFQFQQQQSLEIQPTTRQSLALFTLTLPIWNQYETLAAKSSYLAKALTAKNNLIQIEKESEIKNQFLEKKIESYRQNLVETKNNLEISRKLYADILKGFRNGRISTNDLFIEQNRLLDSENNFALGQLLFHQGLVEACALYGFTMKNCLQ